MSTKNRTIPLNTKEQIEVQTQVNLIDSQFNHLQNRRSSQPSHVRISEIITTNNILKSFTNRQIYHELSQLLNEMKTSSNQEANIGKRITLIQKQLEGLMRRETLLYDGQDNKDQKNKGYYEALCGKDNEILQLEYKNAYNQKKLTKYQTRLAELEKEIKILQKTVELGNIAIAENQIYKEFVKSIKDEKNTDKKKITELQSQLKKKKIVSPKNIKLSTHKNNQEAISISKYFASELERLQKQNQLSAQKLNETMMSLYEANNNIIGNNQQIFANYSYRSSYEQLKEKYSQLSGVFKSEIEQLQRFNPSIKGLKNVQNLISLTEQDEKEIQMVNITGWVGIGKIHRISMSSSNVQNSETNSSKKILAAFVQSFKTLTEKYPKILLQIPSQLKLLLSNSEFLQQTIDLQSINNLKQIVTYQPQIIRVQNVYQYNNEKDKSLIFNLRVLIKSLVEEFAKIKQNHKIDVNIDEGILEMLKGQVIQGLDVNSVLKLYRPLPKIVQVQRIVERPVYINGTLEKAVPIFTERAILAQTITEKAIQVMKEVPIYIQRVVDNPIKQFIEVVMQTEKIVEIPTIRQVLAEKLLTNQTLKQVQVQKVVTVYEQKIVEVINNTEIIVQIPKIVQIQKPIQLPVQKEYIEVQKIVQKPVYIRQVREKIKQVEVINEKLFEKDRYIQIQQKVPHIITNRQTVYLDREVPRFITNTEEIQVNMTEVIQKIVPYKILEQRIVQVPVIREKQLIRQIEREVQVQITHFIKGDREEVIKEVEVIVEKPLREQFLITRNVEIQKIVPLYHKSEKPIYVELQIPYIRQEAKLVHNETCKIVTVTEQIIKEVRVEVPVPVIVEKQVIKIETVYVDRIIEKIVEVPRIVEIQRIVQKIVPIPRIIQKIVQVPRIIQKIVTIEVPCLQIVEVIREIPVIRQIQVIKQVIIERPQIQIIKQIQIAQRQKFVEIVIEKQIPKQIQVERRIPIQVIREVPVEVSRDRIIQKIIQIHEVTVKDRQVMVPFRYEVPVELIVQKAVATEKVVENIVKIVQTVQKQVPLRTIITVPEMVEVSIEKVIQKQVIREIPGPETIIYIEVPKQIQVLREKIVQVENSIQVPKQVYLYMDKIVHEYHQQLQMVEVPKIVERPQLVQISKPHFITSYKQVPVIVETNRNVPVRTIVEQIKQVQKQVHHQQEVQIFREKIKQIIKETKQYIQKQVQKQLLREVVINQTRLQQIQVPTEPQIVETTNTVIEMKENSKFIERVVERIVMLPQIVQVTKHFHQITEVQSLGIASGIAVEQHTKQYVSVSEDLKLSLVDLLEKFKQNVTRQPDLKNLIAIIEAHLKQIDNWISFPKILQIPKQIQKIVQKQKIVLVPTSDQSKQATLSYLVQKLLNQLKRVKDRNRVDLQLDDEIMKLFFKDTKTVVDDRKVEEFQKQLKRKYQSMGQWTKSYPFMVKSFLQDFFTLNSIIEESNNTNKLLKERNQALSRQVNDTEAFIVSLNSQNSQLSRNYSLILDALKQNKGAISSQEIQRILRYGSSSKLSDKQLIIKEGQMNGRQSQVTNYKISGQSIGEMPVLIGKLSLLQSKNSEILTRNKLLEYENEKLLSQLKSTLQSSSSMKVNELSNMNSKIIEQIRTKLIQQNDSKIKRIQDSQNQQIQRLKDSQSQQIQRLQLNQQRQLQRINIQRKSSVNTESNNQIKKMTQELRLVKRELQTQKRCLDGLKRQHQLEILNIKQSYEKNLQKKESNISSIEHVKGRIAEEYERKIFQLKQTHQKEIEKIKASWDKKQERRVSKGDISEQTGDLLLKIKSLELQLQTTRKENELQLAHRSKMGMTMVTGSVFTSGVKQGQIMQRFSPESKTQRILTYQSSLPHAYVSAHNNNNKVAIEEDRLSERNSSFVQSEKPSEYKSKMSLRELMDIKNDVEKVKCTNNIIVKILQKMQQEARHGYLHCFNPENIYLSNFNPRRIAQLKIKLGAPINLSDYKEQDRLYLAPELLINDKITTKSVCFNVGVIWDEFVHGSVFFKNVKELTNVQPEFVVRDPTMNPLCKNALFEMMYKNPDQRIDLYEPKKRVSLQRFIEFDV